MIVGTPVLVDQTGQKGIVTYIAYSDGNSQVTVEWDNGSQGTYSRARFMATDKQSNKGLVWSVVLPS